MLNRLARAHDNLLQYNYSYRSPYTLFLLLLLAVAALTVPGCSTPSGARPTPPNGSATQMLVVKLAVQAAAIRQIRYTANTPDEATARAGRIKAVAQRAQTWLDTAELPLGELSAASRARLNAAIAGLPPEEQLVARALSVLIETTLKDLLAQQSPTLPATPEGAKTTVNTLLNWVIEATEAYGV